MKKKYIILCFVVFILILVIMIKVFGFFHNEQSWDEYRFLGKNINELRVHLAGKGRDLRETREVAEFEYLSQKKVLSTQKLYIIIGGGREKTYPTIYILMTRTFYLYVLVENNTIVFFQQSEAFDGP